MRTLTLAYYCSGHGYGHATRVSAFASHLLKLPNPPVIYIVSSAPERVFSDSIADGAHYRYADIDPVVVQPLAYFVDRQASVDVLRQFMSQKFNKLENERQWLASCGVDAVLSDAAFLGCLAATEVGIPAVLITNFTFDSVYSYLATPLLQPASTAHPHSPFEDILTDEPVEHEELAPLVSQIWDGYRCAGLLVRLPGFIPIPSFIRDPALPASEWVDAESGRLHPESISKLQAPLDSVEVVPGPSDHPSREVIQSPLVVRPPTTESSPYTQTGRARILSAMGVPVERHNPEKTKILIVSFGGQTFRAPRTPSRTPSPSPRDTTTSMPLANGNSNGGHHDTNHETNGIAAPTPYKPQQKHPSTLAVPGKTPAVGRQPPKRTPTWTPGMHARSTSSPVKPSTVQFPSIAPRRPDFFQNKHLRNFSTPSHLYIPGAPPAFKGLSSPRSRHASINIGELSASVIVQSPSEESGRDLSNGGVSSEAVDTTEEEEDGVAMLLPEDWIAIVCGVSKEQWDSGQNHDLPDGFYIAPRDVYMPDLTAVADALLGKLGYGTTSECVDACTAFIYVSRPLFVEEHGLRILLETKGTGVEMARRSYEMGEWAPAIEEAYERNKELKRQKRAQGAIDLGVTNQGKIRETAAQVLQWIQKRKAIANVNGDAH